MTSPAMPGLQVAMIEDPSGALHCHDAVEISIVFDHFPSIFAWQLDLFDFPFFSFGPGHCDLWCWSPKGFSPGVQVLH